MLPPSSGDAHSDSGTIDTSNNMDVDNESVRSTPEPNAQQQPRKGNRFGRRNRWRGQQDGLTLGPRSAKRMVEYLIDMAESKKGERPGQSSKRPDAGKTAESPAKKEFTKADRLCLELKIDAFCDGGDYPKFSSAEREALTEADYIRISKERAIRAEDSQKEAESAAA